MHVADRRAHIDLLEAYRLHNDREARDRLVEELMPLVRSLARRYAGRGEPVDDLEQVGAIGLIKAIDRFDLDRGLELSTYAVPTIVGEIRRHFRDRSWGVHVPRRMKELSLQVSRLVDDLSSTLGRTPTVSEIAAAAEVEEEEVIEALETARAYTPTSLATPVDASGELTLIDLLGDDEAGYEAVERGSVVRTGLDGLDERARKIVDPAIPPRDDTVRDRRGARHVPDACVAAVASIVGGNARPHRRERGRCRVSRESVHLVFPARAEYLVLARLALTGIARIANTDEEALADLRLAVTEAAANACRHAYPDDAGEISLRLELTAGDRLEVILEDDGPGFDVAEVEDWRPGELGEDGMGLAIIRAVAEEVEIGPRPSGSGTRIRFTRALR